MPIGNEKEKLNRKDTRTHDYNKLNLNATDMKTRRRGTPPCTKYRNKITQARREDTDTSKACYHQASTDPGTSDPTTISVRPAMRYYLQNGAFAPITEIEAHIVPPVSEQGKRSVTSQLLRFRISELENLEPTKT